MASPRLTQGKSETLSASSKAKWFGYNAPFIGGNENVMSLQIDERLIKNDLLQLLLTAPGERVMRPDFGTIIRPSLFEQLDDIQKEAIEDSINEQVERFEGRVRLTDIIIDDDGANLINIKIFGFLDINIFGGLAGSAADASLLVELDIPREKTVSTLSSIPTG